MKKHRRIHIGLRTTKTAAAVIISMLIVELYGATSSKLIFAMLYRELMALAPSPIPMGGDDSMRIEFLCVLHS